jgi:drug/metabolite transporter (DMT)-like permease
MERTPARVHAALFLVAVLFSLNYLLGKIVLRQIDPRAFALLRVTGSALILWLFRERGPAVALTATDRRNLVFFALLGVVFNQLFFIAGLSLTSAHEAAILITTIPVFTLLAALVLRRERFSRSRLSGIALAAAGAAMVLVMKGAQGNHGSLAGDLLILMNCLSYGLYLVLSRPTMFRLSARRVVGAMFVLGAPLMLPFTVDALFRQNWHSPTAGTWAALAGVIVGPTVAAYLLSAWALGQAESSVVASYIYVQPVVATILAVVFLHEEVHPAVAMAAVLIFAGVFVASGGWRRPAPADVEFMEEAVNVSPEGPSHRHGHASNAPGRE